MSPVGAQSSTASGATHTWAAPRRRTARVRALIRAVLFDFGGVILTSPFEAFARYERTQGLPDGVIRTINATNPDDNAWAHLERGAFSLDEFA